MELPLELVASQYQLKRLRRDLQAITTNGSRNAHNVCAAFDIMGSIDIDAYAAACSDMLSRHVSLCMVADPTDPDLHVGIVKHADSPLVVIDAAGADDATVAELVEEQASYKFALHSEIKFRPVLINRGALQWVAVTVVDHLVCDGTSLTILLEDLSDAYACRVNGSSTVKLVPPSYFEFSRLHKSDGAEAERKLEYWRTILDPLQPFPEIVLPGAFHVLPGPQTAASLLSRCDLDVRSAARTSGTTPYSLVAAAVNLTVYALSGSTIVPTAVAIDTRPEGFEATVGWFAAVTLQRHVLKPADSLLATAKNAQLLVFEAIENAIPTASIVAEFQPNRHKGQQQWRPFLFVDVELAQEQSALQLVGTQAVERQGVLGGGVNAGVGIWVSLFTNHATLTMQYEAEAWPVQHAKRFLDTLARALDLVVNQAELEMSTAALALRT